MTEQAKHLPLVLVILDGWGIAPAWGGNAISLAKTPTMNEFWRTMPHTQLKASGEAVGLPTGIIGNSEVGHLNIGAGKIVKQFLPLIDDQIASREFFKNPVLTAAMEKAKSSGKTLHLMGILSDGSVHGHIRHLFALLEMAKQIGVEKIAIDAFTDGRDAEPTGALSYLDKLDRFIKSIHSPAVLTSVMGRFYAMDRDNRWERTQKAYDCLVAGKAEVVGNAREAISKSYTAGVIDEFIEPILIKQGGGAPTLIQDGDVVICYNFRSDRMRQLTQALCGKGAQLSAGSAKPPTISIVTFAEYQAGLPVEVAFHPEVVDKSLAVCVSNAGLKQFHVAETEKYAHVTYFFNGGIESPQTLETRLLIPSPKVTTYDLKPEMAAAGIADAILEKLKGALMDFYVVNFANADMVGHTGNIKATVIAVETIDAQLTRIWEAVKQTSGVLIITADHGNAEQKINPETGLPDTEHTKNPVPFIICTTDAELAAVKLKTEGCLGNVAPTVLEIIGIEKPATMNLDSLIIH